MPFSAPRRFCPLPTPTHEAPRLWYGLLASISVLVLAPAATAARIDYDLVINQEVRGALSAGETTTIAPGDHVQLVIHLLLDDALSEVASVVDAGFGYRGAAHISDLALDFDRLTGEWPFGAFGNADADGFRVSLTSENRGGRRQIAALEFVALEIGIFDLLVTDISVAADLDVPPFLTDVLVEAAPGVPFDPARPLASFSVVVPEPSTAMLLVVGLIACSRRRAGRRPR